MESTYKLEQIPVFAQQFVLRKSKSASVVDKNETVSFLSRHGLHTRVKSTECCCRPCLRQNSDQTLSFLSTTWTLCMTNGNSQLQAVSFHSNSNYQDTLTRAHSQMQHATNLTNAKQTKGRFSTTQLYGESSTVVSQRASSHASVVFSGRYSSSASCQHYSRKKCALLPAHIPSR